MKPLVALVYLLTARLAFGSTLAAAEQSFIPTQFVTRLFLTRVVHHCFFSNEIRSIYNPKKQTRPKSISWYLSIDTPNLKKTPCYNLYVKHKTKVTLFSIPLDTILENTKTTSRCKSLEHIPDRSDRTINFNLLS